MTTLDNKPSPNTECNTLTAATPWLVDADQAEKWLRHRISERHQRRKRSTDFMEVAALGGSIKAYAEILDWIRGHRQAGAVFNPWEHTAAPARLPSDFGAAQEEKQ